MLTQGQRQTFQLTQDLSTDRLFQLTQVSDRLCQLTQVNDRLLQLTQGLLTTDYSKFQHKII